MHNNIVYLHVVWKSFNHICMCVVMCILSKILKAVNSEFISRPKNKFAIYIISGAYEPPEGRKERPTTWNGI